MAQTTPVVCAESAPVPLASGEAFICPFLVAIEVKPSAIHGQGVFVKKSAKRGTILCNVFRSPDVNFAKESEIITMWHEDPDRMTLITGRLHGDYFAYGTYQDAECFLNHSDTPNAVNYLGQTIALRDLKAGEEITIDYRLIFAEGMSIVTDKGLVIGYSKKDAEKITAALMAGLMKHA